MIVLFLLPAMIAAAQTGSGVHPGKVAFADAQQWPAVTPGQVTLKNFVPFRAVYRRTYKQGAGPKAGEPRIDRVITTAENVAWDGREAILFNMIDSAEAHYEDTNSRTLALYVDARSLAVIFEMGPVPGAGKDYYLLRVLEDKVMGTFVTTDKGESKNQSAPTRAPGFGAPAPWLLASMDLAEGRRIRFAPAYSVGLGALGTKAPFRVIARQKITCEGGRQFDAWIVESIGNLTSPWVQRTAVTDHPPYLIRRTSVNLDSGEENISMDLLDVQTFSR